MTTIRVKPEELEIVAKHALDAEEACQRAQESLSWTLPSLVMEIPGIGSAAIHELKDELVHWLRRYEEKLNEAEELLYRTAAAMRQADQTLADNMREFGLELLGWYDLQRLFEEYDPITGERISGWDRLLAGGMLLLIFIPPAKGAGIAGKAGIKGAKASETTADVSKLLSQMKHVLRYDKIMPAFQAVYHQVVKAPITETICLFKKQWDDLLDSVRSVQWKPALAGVGPVPRVWMKETEEEAVSSIHFSTSRVGDEVIGKGTEDATYKGTGKTGADNIALYAKYKEVLKATELANPLVDSLRQTGRLPSNYVSKTVAMQKGWAPGKALNNYVPGGQIGGDVFKNTSNVLPNAPGRVWYEADVGLSNTMSRSKQPGTRLLYSNDGLMYITTDHYKTVHFIGTYK
jgi:Pre-toxin TG/ribonuclease